MCQITEQFNPNSVIFHGQSGDKYCQIVVLKTFKCLWMANLYYFFVAHRVGREPFEWIGFGKLKKSSRQIETEIINLCRTKLYEQISINHNALKVLWFIEGNVGEIPQKSFEELYL